MNRDGFTLLEALIALTLSTIIVALVSSVFLAQNNFFATVSNQSTVQDNVRTMTAVLASEIRGISPGGVRLAAADRFAVRVPLAIGGVCDPRASQVRVHLSGFADIDTGAVVGYAVGGGSGAWTYQTATWASIFSSSGATDAGACATNGADTAGAAADFVNLNIAGVPTGDLVMLFSEVEYSIAASVLQPGSLALYRGPFGGTLTELVTGLTADAGFQYRRGDSIYYDAVVAGDLLTIDGLRLTALGTVAEAPAGTAFTFGWTVKIPMESSF